MTYPEHDKLAAIADKSQTIGEFLEWCEDQGWGLAGYYRDRLEPIRFLEGGPGSMDALLARYFDIDRVKLEEEKRAMPMKCNDCERPIYWSETDYDYHHAENPERGCFLIGAE